MLYGNSRCSEQCKLFTTERANTAKRMRECRWLIKTIHGKVTGQYKSRDSTSSNHNLSTLNFISQKYRI